PFDIKIDEYIKSLENIFDQGQGTQKERVRALLDNYRTASSWPSHKTDARVQELPGFPIFKGEDRKISKNWKKARKLDNDDHKYQTKKTRSGRNIPNYCELFDETSIPDIRVQESEEENVIRNNEQQPENIYDKEPKRVSTTSQSDNESDDREECQVSQSLYSRNYNYNIYGLDWKTRGVWRLGLLQKVKLPLSIDKLQIIEKLIISLLRVEEALHRIRKIRDEILTEKARLYRSRRISTYAMDYSICEHGRIA
ncbi:8514_t:CDS:2, partial [Diversispora eburnea]